MISRILFVGIASLLSLSVSGQRGLIHRITGDITGLPDGTKVYLLSNLKDRPKTDTIAATISKGGRFVLERRNDFESRPFGFIRIENVKKSTMLLLDPTSHVYVKADMVSWPAITVKNSPSNQAYFTFMQAYNYLKNSNDSIRKLLNQAINTNDSAQTILLRSQQKKIVDSILQLAIQFINQHPEMEYSAFLAQRTSMDYLEKIATYAKLSPPVQKSYAGRELKKQINELEKARRVYKGAILPELISTMPTGQRISIQQIAAKSKYTLIDCWASWCAPCRAEAHHIKKVYNEFHDQGFNVLGISFDFKAEPWRNAIIKDSLNWDHLSDLKGRKGEIHEVFNLDGIPAYLLIDQQGRVIETDIPRLKDSASLGSNLRGAKLYRLIAYLLSSEPSFVQARKTNEAFDQTREALRQQLQQANLQPDKMKEIENQIQQHDKMVEAYWGAYPEQHPESTYSLQLLASCADTLSLAVLEESYNRLNENIKEGKNNQYVLETIANKKNVAIAEKKRAAIIAVGKIAPDFTAITPEGDVVRLHNFVKRGKYTYLDFWASWCTPCRAETPNLRKLHAAYSHKGFNVLSFSVDRDTTAWEKAIREDAMTWCNVAEVGGGAQLAYQLHYIVNTIPTSYLLDEAGKIIAINLTSEALEKKLAELYGTQ